MVSTMDRVVEVSLIFGNGRIQVKKKVREILDVSDGDEIYFKQSPEGRIYIEKADIIIKSGAGKYVREV